MVKRGGITLLVLAIVGAVGFFLWQERRIEASEEQTGLLSSRVLSAVFTATSDLRVATLSGEVFARAKGCSLNCWVPNGQETRAPYSVNYFVNLKALPISAFRWDAEDRIMSIDVPDVTIADVNIDMSRARTKQSGGWISRDSGIAMQKQAAGYLGIAARAKAKDPDNVAKARDAARASITRFVEAPLAAAGLGGVRVVVRLPGDATPAGLSAEQWDRSRSLAEVLGDMR